MGKHHLDRRHARAGSDLSFLGGIGLGAGLMYIFDPDRGRRRRAMAQQKAFRLLRVAGDALDKGVRDLEHRAQGSVTELFSTVRGGPVPDQVLEERVRAKLGRVAAHPGAIEAEARNGRVTLRGPVLHGETPDIVRAVGSVRGVRDVEPQLEEHSPAEGIPGLQGPVRRPGDRPELLQENWAPGTRLIMGGIGVALLLRGLRNSGLLGGATAVLGLGLLARSARGTRVTDEVADIARPAPGPRAGQPPAEPVGESLRQQPQPETPAQTGTSRRARR